MQRERLFYVEFTGEAGLDWGGIYRDAMTRAVDDLFSGHLDLFIPCRNATAVGGTRANADRWVPNPKYAHPSPRVAALYDFVGRLMGLSLRQRLYLAFPLAGLVWRSLCNEPVDLGAVAEVDLPAAECIAGVARLLDGAAAGAAANTASAVAAPAPTRQAFVVPGADGVDVELIPGGRAMPVSSETAAQYVALATQFKTREFAAQVDAMRAGLAAVIPPRAITLCTSAGLELRVCGDAHVDIEALKAHTVYNGYFKVRRGTGGERYQSQIHARSLVGVDCRATACQPCSGVSSRHSMMSREDALCALPGGARASPSRTSAGSANFASHVQTAAATNHCRSRTRAFSTLSCLRTRQSPSCERGCSQRLSECNDSGVFLSLNLASVAKPSVMISRFTVFNLALLVQLWP